MPTFITHSIVGLATGTMASRASDEKRHWLLFGIGAMVPDLDALGLRFGVPYDSFYGHRGFFHSFLFGLLISLVVVDIFFRDTKLFSKGWWRLVGVFFLIVAGHGLLDTLTHGGLGIALVSPFDTTRYFSPFRPIDAAPFGFQIISSSRGRHVLLQEILWLWVPSLALIGISNYIRRGQSRRLRSQRPASKAF